MEDDKYRPLAVENCHILMGGIEEPWRQIYLQIIREECNAYRSRTVILLFSGAHSEHGVPKKAVWTAVREGKLMKHVRSKDCLCEGLVYPNGFEIHMEQENFVCKNGEWKRVEVRAEEGDTPLAYFYH